MAATILSKAVFEGKKMVENGEKNVQTILDAQTKIIESEPLAKIDYVSAVDFSTLEDAAEVKPDTLFAMAVYIGNTRLIDNFLA